MRIVALAAAVVLAAGCASSECCGRPAAPANAAAPEIRMVEPSKGYPIAMCVVSGEDLEETGAPLAILYGTTEVQFCCEHCIDKFRADPKKYLEVLAQATADAKAKAAK